VHQHCLNRLVDSAADNAINLFDTIINKGLDLCWNLMLKHSVNLSDAIGCQSLNTGFKFEFAFHHLAIEHRCECFLEHGVAGPQA
jgi:hypothetical protein